MIPELGTRLDARPPERGARQGTSNTPCGVVAVTSPSYNESHESPMACSPAPVGVLGAHADLAGFRRRVEVGGGVYRCSRHSVWASCASCAAFRQPFRQPLLVGQADVRAHIDRAFRGLRTTVRLVKELAGILVFLVPACFLIWVSVRVLRSPEESWAEGRSRWIAVAPLRDGERPPSARELRVWAVVWLVIAIAILALGLAVGLSA